MMLPFTPLTKESSLGLRLLLMAQDYLVNSAGGGKDQRQGSH